MNDIITKDEVIIENLIYEIRGKQVILDSDLAKLYKCKNGTKEINQAVKNNIEKFPERFSWILTDEEVSILRSKILTTNHGKLSNMIRVNPRVFTEQGVAMLATIIKSKTATKVSISIMDAFVKMRHFIKDSLIEQKYINNMVLEHDNSIKLLQETFDKFEEKRKVNEIYFNGQIYDAYSKIQDIFKSATKKLVIIDAYADNTLLDIIKRLDIEVTIITKKDNLLTKQDIEKYNKQYHNLKVIFNNNFHDRYFLIDNETVYHCGSSINRIGYKTFSINLVNDKEVCEMLLNKINEIT